MSENRIPERQAAARKKKSRTLPALLIFLPAVIAVVAIVLGCFAITFPYILNLITIGFGVFEILFPRFTKEIFSSIIPFILALVLPAAVIAAKRLRIPLLTYGVFFGAIAFLAVQLLFALLCLILSFFTLDTGSFWLGVSNFFEFFPGSEVMSSLLSMIKTPLNYFNELFIIGFIGILKRTVQMLGNTGNYGIRAFSELLFIAKNALCLYLGWKMVQRMQRKQQMQRRKPTEKQ